jgi:hypothetical protein
MRMSLQEGRTCAGQAVTRKGVRTSRGRFFRQALALKEPLPGFLEAHTYAKDVEDPSRRAADALATATGAYIKDRRDTPSPSAIVAKYRVAVPAPVKLKIRLYETIRDANIGPSKLARRLDWHLPKSIDGSQ